MCSSQKEGHYSYGNASTRLEKVHHSVPKPKDRLDIILIYKRTSYASVRTEWHV